MINIEKVALFCINFLYGEYDEDGDPKCQSQNIIADNNDGNGFLRALHQFQNCVKVNNGKVNINDKELELLRITRITHQEDVLIPAKMIVPTKCPSEQELFGFINKD